MKIAVLKETRRGETRVAAIPETVKKFIALGADGRGRARRGRDARRSPMRISRRRARRVGSRAEVLKGADIILCVARARPGVADGRRSRARCWSARSIRSRRREAIDGYAAAGLEALAMEWMPRITRAQSMDILSSQSNLAGYKAVIDAAAPTAAPFR